MTYYNKNFAGTQSFSDTCFQAHLAANTAITYTVPGTNVDAYRADFKFNVTSNVYVGLNVTPTVPASNVSSTTNNVEFLPDLRYVKGGDVISFISPDTDAYVGVSLLKLPN